MTRPSILNIGLAPDHPILSGQPMKFSPEELEQSVKETRVKMKELGYDDFKSQYLDPDKHIEEITALLKERSWDALVIGGGYKMIPALNTQLEDVINIAKDLSPKTRILFTLMPNGVPDAVKRLNK